MMHDLLKHIDQTEARFETTEAKVQAFVPEPGRFDDLRREAQELRGRAARDDRRPPLYGELVGVKDVIHAGGFLTRAGCRVPPEELQGDEAEAITRIRAAGALILGKTVTAEFAYFAPGPTRNPHNMAHTPGGSSSGSAAAVAAGLCSLALGTQTIGSIIRPAAYCGVVGLMPSRGRISNSGLIPLSTTLDQIGTFTPDVARARRAASQLYRDWGAAEAQERKPVLGIPEGPYLERASAASLNHFRETCNRLERAGYAIRRIPALENFEEIFRRHHRIIDGEAARVHAAWFDRHAALYAPETVKLVERGRAITDAELSQALEERARLVDDLRALMERWGIDLWITPATPGPAPEGLDSTGDPVMNLPWTHAGLPTLNLPAGKTKSGLPLGLQVTGRWYRDEDLLAWAERMAGVVS